MTEEETFKFACPHCGRHLRADGDMAGMCVDCPACGQALIVPVGRSGASCRRTAPVVKVIRRREGILGKCKRHMKAVATGLVVLFLFVGAGVVMEHATDASVFGNGADAEAEFAKKAVTDAIQCLGNYLDARTEVRLNALSQSLERCPKDFQEAVNDFLITLRKTPDDMISAREREDAQTAGAFLGLLAGAASDNPGDALTSGLLIGGAIHGEMQQKAQLRLQQELKYKLANLIDIARKYGADSNDPKNALQSK